LRLWALVNVTVNGKRLEVPDGITVLETIRKAGFNVPTLCTLEGLVNTGVCRMCVVEVERARLLIPSCSTPVSEGMVIWTETPRVQVARRTVLQMLASEHTFDCKNCPRNGNCELQRLAFSLNLDDTLVEYHVRDLKPDLTNKAVMMDFNRCILCGRCIRSCSEIQTVYAIDYAFRGYNTVVSSPLGEGLGKSPCVSCGLCTLNCPVAAIQENPGFQDVEKDFEAPLNNCSIVDPLVLITMSEEFWVRPGEGWVKDIEAFLKSLGFISSLVSYDGFDLSIINEAYELIHALNSRSQTVVSAACPAAVDFIVKFFPSLTPRLVKTQTPQFLLGSLIRAGVLEQTYGINRDSKLASISYCLACKSQIYWPPYLGKHLNYLISVRELANIARVKRHQGFEVADISHLQASPSILDMVSGGRAELVVKTAHRLLGEKLDADIVNPLRGEGEYKSTTVRFSESEVKVIVANTLRVCRNVLESLDKSHPVYVELRACPDGCVGGGGQPIPSSKEVRHLRSKAVLNLYERAGRISPWDSMWSRTLHRKAEEAGVTRLGGLTE